MTQKIETQLILTDLSRVEAREPDWLWPGYIPSRMVSLETGDPDAGKTLVLVSMAATKASGGLWPNGVQVKGGSVLYLDFENGDEEMRRRFDATGFRAWDFLRIASQVTEGGKPKPFQLDVHLAALRDAIREMLPSWVIIDPLVAAHQKDESKATSVRQIMNTFRDISQEFKLAITVVQHPNKMSQAPHLYRVRGSLDFVAAARAVLRVTHTREEEVRALVVDKLNMAPKPPPMGFRIVDRHVEWLGEVDLGDQRDTSKLDVARKLLTDLLLEGPTLVSEIQEAAKAEGIGWRTVQTAKSRLCIRSRKQGADSSWVWEFSIPTFGRAQPAQEPQSQGRKDSGDFVAKDAKVGGRASLGGEGRTPWEAEL